MTRDNAEKETGPINTSYLLIFHAVILFVAPFVTKTFPPELRSDALMVALVFPIVLFWFSYLIKQFIDTSLIFKLILGAAFVVAALSFLNAIYGDLSGDYVPVIYTQVPFFATLLAGLSGPIGLIYAGTILTYGAYVYIFCVGVASLSENIYDKYARHLLTKKMTKKLTKIDKSVDITATQASDRFFVFNQTIGFMICLALISVYAALYIYLLIK